LCCATIGSSIGFPQVPAPHWQHDDVETIFGVVKARRTPLVSPRLRVRRQVTLATTHFCPELPTRGCFFEPLRRCCLGRNYGFKLLADVDGGIIRRMGPDRTKPATSDLFSTHMVQDGSPLPRRHPPTPLRNAMSFPGTCPTRSSISLILN
jgi:hypothetical protein